MASDPKLLARIEMLLSGHKGVAQRKMLGGACFMLVGNVCAELIVRAGEERADAFLGRAQSDGWISSNVWPCAHRQ